MDRDGAINPTGTLQEIRIKYDMVVKAHRQLERSPSSQKEYFKMYYRTQLDNYRDLCTLIVEKLMQTNPTALEEIELWNIEK
jgi:hypothetical protein